MQLLEIWNNLFTKGLQIHSIFLSYLFLIYFVNFEKNQNLMLIYINLRNFNQPNAAGLKKFLHY
jgi:hypothetical protein